MPRPLRSLILGLLVSQAFGTALVWEVKATPPQPAATLEPAAFPLQAAFPQPTNPSTVQHPQVSGPTLFVDGKAGSDQNAGTQEKPWRTIGHAVENLKPGATLYLRGGTYFENVSVRIQGTPQAPITIRSYPGELAIIDGGIPAFQLNPSSAWIKAPDGAEDEYESTASFPNIRDVVGFFQDSKVGLQTYSQLKDLRATNENWQQTKLGSDIDPIYVGPGICYSASSGKIRARFAPTHVPKITNNYEGPTDPRTFPVVIAPFRSVPLHLDGAKNVQLQDLLIRGGGYDTVVLDLCENIGFDNVVIRAGTYGMRLANVRGFKFFKSAIYGNNPPWGFRTENSLRSRGGSKSRDVSRLTCHALLVSETGREFSVYAMPVNDDWEISYSEFNNCHDGLYLGGINVKFHHNLVENCHDDGIYLSAVYPQWGSSKIEIYENLFKDVLTSLACGAEFTTNKDKIFVYRNVFDMRGIVMYQRPGNASEKGVFETTAVAGDHGSPPWPEMAVYQNTFLINRPRLSFMGVTSADPGLNPRRVFNNLFVAETMATYGGPDPAKKVFEDGNLFWGTLGNVIADDYFKKYRLSPQFTASKTDYPEGSSSHSKFADPKLAADYTLGEGSAAVDAGIPIPADWPDSLRDKDKGTPDIGALPQGNLSLKAGLAN